MIKQQTVDFSNQNPEDSPTSESTSTSLHEDLSNSPKETTLSSAVDAEIHIDIHPPLKRSNVGCFTLSLLEQYGAIQFICKQKQFFISKLQKVLIKDDFSELFEKGKLNPPRGNFLLQEIGSIPDMTFWYQRYYYYSKFDEGIQMDYESWYSVTPEAIAKYIAIFINGKTVIDGFCGSGGNVIQFSKYCKKVYAIDIDESKLEICKNNCKVYNCEDNIEFIFNDYLKMNGKIKADYVFLSPPWGGIKYKDNEVYSISKLMTPSIYDIIRTSLTIANNIIFYVPRNLDLEELFNIVSFILNEQNPGQGNNLNFDVKILKSNNKIKALLILFGSNLSEVITSKDLQHYINAFYDYVTFENIRLLNSISSVIGLTKFFKSEFAFKNNHSSNNNDRNVYYLIKYFFNCCLTEQEKTKVKTSAFQSGINLYNYFNKKQNNSYGASSYFWPFNKACYSAMKNDGYQYYNPRHYGYYYYHHNYHYSYGNKSSIYNGRYSNSNNNNYIA